MTTVLCLASFFKGLQLLTAYHRLGCRIVVVASMALRDQPWPEDCIDDLHFVPDMADIPSLLKGVNYLGREERFDLVVPMEEYCVEAAATLRAHLGCPGFDETTARRVRDKYTMRRRAHECGIPVPEFELVLNYQRIGEYLHSVPGPWVIKPRAEGGAVQIHKVNDQEAAWQVVHQLGDDQSRHLIERFVPGDVCHVDSVINHGKPVVSVASRYGKPPFDVWNGGGVFMSSTVGADDPLQKRLLALNEEVIEAMGLDWGAAHVEFIHGRDGQLYFLEIGARVCGANLDRLVWAASGVDLFFEQARVDMCRFRGEPYTLNPERQLNAGLLVCLSKDQHPDLSFCDSEEVVWKLRKDYHAGMVVASPASDRVSHLMREYSERLAAEHLAVMPPALKPT